MIGGCSRTRTCDPLIKSQLLWNLSYAPAVTPSRRALSEARQNAMGGASSATSELSCSNASDTAPLPRALTGLTQRNRPLTSCGVLKAGCVAKNRCPATLSARLPWHGKHCCPCRQSLLGRHPPGSERRACSGVSIAMGDADPEDEDDGQQATPQASKEPREGRSRRSEHAGAQPPTRTPTAHSTGPVKVHGDPDRFSSPGGGCGSRRSLRGHRTVEELDAVVAASGFTI